MDTDALKDKEAENWQLDSMKKLISNPKTEKDLDNDWHEWESMEKYDRKQSDDKCMQLYGMTNKERYEQLKYKFNDSDIDNKPVDKEYTPVNQDMGNVGEAALDDVVNFEDIDYPESAGFSAENWSFHSMIAIIRPRATLDQLESDWIKYQSMTGKFKNVSDDKSVELFGINNQTHYEYLKSKFLKSDIDKTELQDEYSPDSSSSFIESACRKIKNSNNLNEISELYLKLLENKERTFHENILIQSTLDDKMELFKDDMADIADDYNDLPFFSPTELSDFGVYSGEGNRYSAFPDNDKLDSDIKPRDWFDMYKDLFNGTCTENAYASIWINKLNVLYSDYDKIKESGDIDKINSRKQSILELGWNPNIPFNIETRLKATERIKSIIREQYRNTKIIDITNFIESGNYLIEESSSEDNEFKPIFVVFLKSDSFFNKAVQAVTKGPYGHVSIGFNADLKTLYSYNARDDGFSQESINRYKDVVNMKVFCIFIRKDKFNRLRENIRYFVENKGKTGYSLMNLITIPLNIDYKSNLNMVCSQFVDANLKLADIDLTKKASSLVTPADMYSKMIRNKKIYKVYDGKLEQYKGKNIRKTLIDLLHKIHIENSSLGNSELKFLQELQNMTNIEYVKETKDFPIQFDEDGNLLIEKPNTIDFEAEFAKSHKLLQAYEQNSNMGGMKYELCKLWYLNLILEKRIYDKKTKKEDLKNYYKVRARILNDFNKYMNVVMSIEKDFNFIQYYEQTPFNDSKVKINSSTLKYTLKYLKSILLPH